MLVRVRIWFLSEKCGEHPIYINITQSTISKGLCGWNCFIPSLRGPFLGIITFTFSAAYFCPYPSNFRVLWFIFSIMESSECLFDLRSGSRALVMMGGGGVQP